MKISFVFARPKHINEIIELVNEESERSGAVMMIDRNLVKRWIADKLSVVALCNGEVVAHQALNIWPRSQWAELRSAVVKEELRGKGIGYKLTKMLIAAHRKKNRKAIFIAIKNKTETGNGILRDLGFKEISLIDVPQELFSIRSYSERKAFKLGPKTRMRML